MDLLMVANGCIMAPDGGFSYGCKLGASQLLKIDLVMVLVELWSQEECALAIQVLTTNLCTCFFVH
jgi:hypothetical protein